MERSGKVWILSSGENGEEAASGLRSPLLVADAAVLYATIEARAIALAARATELATSPIRADKDALDKITHQLGLVAGMQTQVGEVLGRNSQLGEEAAIEAFRGQLADNT